MNTNESRSNDDIVAAIELLRRNGYIVAKAPRPAVVIATCMACGNEFEAKRVSARYCSNACRQAAHRMRSTQ